MSKQRRLKYKIGDRVLMTGSVVGRRDKGGEGTIEGYANSSVYPYRIRGDASNTVLELRGQEFKLIGPTNICEDWS